MERDAYCMRSPLLFSLFCLQGYHGSVGGPPPLYAANLRRCHCLDRTTSFVLAADGHKHGESVCNTKQIDRMHRPRCPGEATAFHHSWEEDDCYVGSSITWGRSQSSFLRNTGRKENIFSSYFFFIPLRLMAFP